MRELRIVTWLELRLFMRRRMLWIAIAWMIFQGINIANTVRGGPLQTWDIFVNYTLFAAIFLVLITGDQITRDRTLRLDGVILATPVRTAAYVWGTYLADLLGLLGLSLVFLATAVLTDRFANWQAAPYFGTNLFPPLGPEPYLAAWAWLMIFTLVTCSVLALAGITVASGQRILAYAAVATLLYLPIVSPVRLDLGDLQTLRLANGYHLTDLSAAMIYREATGKLPSEAGADGINVRNDGVSLDGGSPIASDRLMRIIAGHTPPAFPSVFYWNRAVFLALAALLVGGAIWSVGRRCRGMT